ncbi:MAG: hypothetical protein AAFZ38_03075, partial [Myxococcota bacterium]
MRGIGRDEFVRALERHDVNADGLVDERDPQEAGARFDRLATHGAVASDAFISEQAFHRVLERGDPSDVALTDALATAIDVERIRADAPAPRDIGFDALRAQIDARDRGHIADALLERSYDPEIQRDLQRWYDDVGLVPRDGFDYPNNGDELRTLIARYRSDTDPPRVRRDLNQFMIKATGNLGLAEREPLRSVVNRAFEYHWDPRTGPFHPQRVLEVATSLNAYRNPDGQPAAVLAMGENVHLGPRLYEAATSVWAALDQIQSTSRTEDTQYPGRIGAIALEGDPQIQHELDRAFDLYRREVGATLPGRAEVTRQRARAAFLNALSLAFNTTTPDGETRVGPERHRPNPWTLGVTSRRDGNHPFARFAAFDVAQVSPRFEAFAQLMMRAVENNVEVRIVDRQDDRDDVSRDYHMASGVRDLRRTLQQRNDPRLTLLLAGNGHVGLNHS